MAEEDRWELSVKSIELLGQGKLAEAEAVLKKIISIEPDKPNNWMILGRCQLAQEKLVDAESSARKALELD